MSPGNVALRRRSRIQQVELSRHLLLAERVTKSVGADGEDGRALVVADEGPRYADAPQRPGYHQHITTGAQSRETRFEVLTDGVQL